MEMINTRRFYTKIMNSATGSLRRTDKKIWQCQTKKTKRREKEEEINTENKQQREYTKASLEIIPESNVKQNL